MFESFIGKNVLVIVALSVWTMYGSVPMTYFGVIESSDEKVTTINTTAKLGESSFTKPKPSTEKLTINNRYIISIKEI